MRKMGMLIRTLWRVGEIFVRLLMVTFFVHAVIYLSPGRKAYRPEFSGAWEYIKALVGHYISWFSAVLHGDFGTYQGVPIIERLITHLPRTLGLVAGALIVSSVLAGGLVFLSVIWRDRPAVKWVIQLVRFISGMPILILCLLVIWARKHFMDFTPWMLLILGVGDNTLGDYFTVLREEIGRILSQDYIGAAKGRGCSVLKHAAREISIAVLDIVFSRIPILVGGVIIIEESFAYFGLGHDIVEATNSQSIDLQMGVTVLIAAILIGTSGLKTVLHGVLDPRTHRS